MKKLVILVILSLIFFRLHGQNKLEFLQTGQLRHDINFDISQNLIILPLSINDSEILKFILDSGVSKTIITEMTGVDTVSLTKAREVRLEGLGEDEDLIAWFSQDNKMLIESPTIKGKGIIGEKMDVYVIPEDRFQFSKQFGLQINGLIGSDFFTDFVVSIDYINKSISFSDRDRFNFKRKTKRYTRIPVSIENDKSYLKATVFQENGPTVDVKLLIDTGASMAAWLSVYSDENINLPEKTFNALLGQGLNGNITGVNGRIPWIKIGKHVINNPIVAYPDSNAISSMKYETNRNGTIGNEILKRFHIIFDYKGEQIFIKPNKNYNDPFNYNRSGIEVEKPYYNIPYFRIYNVVEGSPADMAGLKEEDQILMLNFVKSAHLELDQINGILYGTEGKKIRMTVLRNGEKIKVKFTLDNKL